MILKKGSCSLSFEWGWFFSNGRWNLLSSSPAKVLGIYGGDDHNMSSLTLYVKGGEYVKVWPKFIFRNIRQSKKWKECGCITDVHHAEAHKKVQRIKKETKEDFKTFMHDASVYISSLCLWICLYHGKNACLKGIHFG